MNDLLSCVKFWCQKGLLPAETTVKKYMNKNQVATPVSL